MSIITYMTEAQAIRLAIKAIDAEIQRLAVQANLYEFYKMPGGERAYKERQRLREARKILATHKQVG